MQIQGEQEDTVAHAEGTAKTAFYIQKFRHFFVIRNTSEQFFKKTAFSIKRNECIND